MGADIEGGSETGPTFYATTTTGETKSLLTATKNPTSSQSTNS